MESKVISMWRCPKCRNIRVNIPMVEPIKCGDMNCMSYFALDGRDITEEVEKKMGLEVPKPSLEVSW